MFLSKTEQLFPVSGPWCTLWGPCALKRPSGFQAKRISDLKKIEKYVEIFIFCCGFKKCVFVENGVIFAIFFVFPLGIPF